jgi:hypothetical protein
MTSQEKVEDLKSSGPYTATQDKGFSDSTSSEIDLYSKPQLAGETFASGGETRYYKPCDKYEGLHRWDPNAEWTEQEEKKIVRRVSHFTHDNPSKF